MSRMSHDVCGSNRPATQRARVRRRNKKDEREERRGESEDSTIVRATTHRRGRLSRASERRLSDFIYIYIYIHLVHTSLTRIHTYV